MGLLSHSLSVTAQGRSQKGLQKRVPGAYNLCHSPVRDPGHLADL